MSTLRPYWDYVRTSDEIQIQIAIGGQIGWGVLIPAVAAMEYFGGFPENELFSAMRRHGLIVQNPDFSQWAAAVGGWVRIVVGANNDFSHIADVADAAAQAFADLGYSTSGQQAWFLNKVADDITYDETQRYSTITNSIIPAQQNSLHDQVANFPGNVKQGIQNELNSAPVGQDSTWLIVGGIALLLAVAISGGRRRR
jgi:hypothetical protein